jgi:hypothetical protein
MAPRHRAPTAGPKRILLALALVTVPLAGCMGFDPGGDCTAQHAYADRLVLDQDGLYEAMGEAQEQAERVLGEPLDPAGEA